MLMFVCSRAGPFFPTLSQGRKRIKVDGETVFKRFDAAIWTVSEVPQKKGALFFLSPRFLQESLTTSYKFWRNLYLNIFESIFTNAQYVVPSKNISHFYILVNNIFSQLHR